MANVCIRAVEKRQSWMDHGVTGVTSQNARVPAVVVFVNDFVYAIIPGKLK